MKLYSAIRFIMLIALFAANIFGVHNHLVKAGGYHSHSLKSNLLIYLHLCIYMIENHYVLDQVYCMGFWINFFSTLSEASIEDADLFISSRIDRK